MRSNPSRPAWRSGGTYPAAVLVTLGLTAAACTTTPAAKAPAVPSVLGQPKGVPAVVGQPAPAGTGQLDAVTCAGPTHCWAVGALGPSSATGTTTSVPPAAATVIDATIDGGKTWTAQSLTLNPAPALTAVSCPSVRLCMAAGLSTSGTAGVVVTTGDGGASWSQAAVPTGAIDVSGVVCASPTDCTAIATDGTTFWSARSTDFGQTWEREGDLPAGLLDASNLSCALGAACLVTGYTATTAGHGQGAIAISTDGGSTWTAAVVPAGTGLLQDAICATTSSCLAVGTTSTAVSNVVPAHGALLSSADGGHTWVALAGTGPIDDIFGIDCPSGSVCVMVGTKWIGSPAVGTGAVAHSSDGGANFTTSATEYTPLALTGLACPTTRRCVAVGGDTVARITLPAATSSNSAGQPAGLTTLPAPPSAAAHSH